MVHEGIIRRIAAGRTDLVWDLLAAGASPDSVDEQGTSVLRWCAYYGDVSAVRRLTEAGAELAELGANLDLNGAAFHGHWRLCEFLIDEGADPMYPLPDTAETPLHAATCHPGRPAFEPVVHVLLNHGADPNARTIPGIETGSFMRDARTRGESPLHRAAAYGSAGMIQQLLTAGGNTELTDAHGDTPLSWASWHCRPDAILRMLLHGSHRIHPARNSESDHGAGASAMERYLAGGPLPD